MMHKKFDFIYSRGVRGGIVGGLIKGHFFPDAVLLNDIRGFALDGMKKNFINRLVSRNSLKFITRSSQMLFIVSPYLKEKICNEYGFNPHNAHVFPTFVADHKFDFKEENRRHIRKELDFNDNDIVILYSGTLLQYQNLDTIVSSFKLSSNNNLKMLILSKDKAVHELITKYDVPQDKVRIKSASYEEIEKYYHAADFGILIRDNDDTNRSAAPTKFAEYVNSGLSLIINSIDAEYVRIFRKEQLKGVLLDKKEDLLNCFNHLDLSYVERNNAKINVLSDVVKRQKDILERN
jgi:hypothetical protein